MRRGFVFGKYLPFHQGHQALIDFAAQQCNELYVLVCESDKEDIPGALRCEWIRETYKDAPNIHIVLFQYSEAELPNTSVASQEVSRVWALEFLKLLPPMDILVTSEEYGAYVAAFMGIGHFAYDMNRYQNPVSSTMIRTNPYKYWSFIPKAVRPYYCKKVIILGTESTGKTILAEFLADQLNATLVPEAGRQLIANSNKYTLDDLYQVIKVQNENILAAAKGERPLLIIDTDLHITNSYAHFSFGQELDIDADEYKKVRADLYLYLNNDIPHIQDGTRLSRAHRDLLDLSHRNILNKQKVDLVEVRGNWIQRTETALKAIRPLMETYLDLNIMSDEK